MAKSQQTFNKKEREKKKQKKRQEKLERRAQRKVERDAAPKKTFEELIRYVDHDGNIVDTPPDPSKKRVIKASDIVLGVPPNDTDPVDSVRTGIVKFFNHEKGYGFITDRQSKESIFVHINSCRDEIKENDKVTFETERGPKGMVAINVQIEKEKPTPKPEVKEPDAKEEVKSEEVKSEEVKSEEVKSEETTSEEVKSEDTTSPTDT